MSLARYKFLQWVRLVALEHDAHVILTLDKKSLPSDGVIIGNKDYLYGAPVAIFAQGLPLREDHSE